jgi:carbon monoxide dehydrogenase subunit G
MEMSSSRQVPAPRETVWSALNDPEFLMSCIAGCESLEVVGDNAFRIVMVAKIGAIRAKFNGKMHLADLDPPQSYTLVFEGEGGMAGFAKGKADVMLTPDGAGTVLAYTATAQIGGKLAQIGSRLVDAVASKTADEFFAAFSEKLSEASGANKQAVSQFSNMQQPFTNSETP